MFHRLTWLIREICVVVVVVVKEGAEGVRFAFFGYFRERGLRKGRERVK